MTAGLRIFNAAGALRLEVTDRLTRIIQRGSYKPPLNNTTLQTVYVPVNGMTTDGTWVVTVTGNNPWQIVSGGFNVQCYDSIATTAQTNYYTVYRF